MMLETTEKFRRQRKIVGNLLTSQFFRRVLENITQLYAQNLANKKPGKPGLSDISEKSRVRSAGLTPASCATSMLFFHAVGYAGLTGQPSPRRLQLRR